MDHIKIEKNPSLPDMIYIKIYDLIRSGEFKVGQKLLGEKELAKQLNVSRTALREALYRLEMDGFIDRRHGVGTFVISNAPKMTAGLESLESMTNFLKTKELTSGTIKQAVHEIKASKEIADYLQLKEGTPVIRFERVRIADGEPFAYDIAISTSSMLDKKFLNSDNLESLFTYFEDEKDTYLTHSYCEISAKNASPYLANKLDIEEGVALQVLEQIYYKKGNIPVYYGKSYIRSDVLKFHLIRRR